MSGAHPLLIPLPQNFLGLIHTLSNLSFLSLTFLSPYITFIYDDQLVDVFSKKFNRSFMATPIKIGTMVSYTT